MRLKDKTAIITGGGTGIGLASARRFIEEGAFVYIFGRRRDRLEAAASDLGPDARAVAGSVTEPRDLDRLFDTVREERGGLDILFANAGTGSLVPLAEITSEHYEATFDVNVKGTILTVRKALPLMGEGGSIILTGSTTGVMGTPAFSVYSAAGGRPDPRSAGSRQSMPRRPPPRARPAAPLDRPRDGSCPRTDR